MTGCFLQHALLSGAMGVFSTVECQLKVLLDGERMLRGSGWGLILRASMQRRWMAARKSRSLEITVECGLKLALLVSTYLVRYHSRRIN